MEGLEVDGRKVGIDEYGAKWAYGLGFWAAENDCPFLERSRHWFYWNLGWVKLRFVYE